MSAGMLIQIAAYLVLGAAIISSIFWIGLSFTWWKIEKKREKTRKQLEM